MAGKRLAWVHSHERHQLRQLEHSDFFDYVFYGHTHVREQHRTGRTLVANPGALFRANPKTCIVLDVVSGEIKPILIPVAAKWAHHLPAVTGSPAAAEAAVGVAPPGPAPASPPYDNPPPPAAPHA